MAENITLLESTICENEICYEITFLYIILWTSRFIIATPGSILFDNHSYIHK